MRVVDTTVLVLAKAPRPGRSKTRLTPPCTPEQAAGIAAAALADTLDAVARCRAGRKVLVLDGPPGSWLPPGVEVVAQRGDGLDERLAAAFDDVQPGRDGTDRPTLLVGMDTPQLTSAELDRSLERLLARPGRAVLGPAADGGWWAIGLERPDPEVFLGIPMSTDHTGEAQRARLTERGYQVELLAVQRDVDHWDDARAVAALVPGSRFARAVAAVAR